MRASLTRGLTMAATGLLTAGLLTILPATAAHAAQNFDNATIADQALARVGQFGGQCKQFVNDMANIASGGLVRLGGGYYSDYSANQGVLVSAGAAVKGDIIQLNGPNVDQYYNGMHTAIVVSNLGNNTFDVVDSNFGLPLNNQIVHHHSWNPFTTANSYGLSVNIWRLGRVGPSASQYIGKIVQWYNGGGQPNTSWLVRPDGRRYWIADPANFYCWIQVGAVDAGVQSAGILNLMPDSGQTAWCPASSGPTRGDQLQTNQVLRQDMNIRSQDGRFVFVMQSDHNLVLYGPGGALWATNRFTGGYVVMQGDGNLVGYNMWNQPQWASNTARGAASYLLVVQNDGNVVIYGPGGAIWATNTHG